MICKLWNKNFTIITLGSVVSLCGNALSGFAISLLVLNYTGSTFLYALFMVAYNLPKLVMPLLAGPYIDNFPRAKVIYTLDFTSAGLYLLIWFLLRSSFFEFWAFLASALVIGSIDSVYQVAYDSLYPTLVPADRYAKAYAVSSALYPLAAVMLPVAAWVYGKWGFGPLFLANAASFFVAACFETQIRAPEEQLAHKAGNAGLAYLREEFREGFRYLRLEKGLLFITAYFFVTMMAGNAAMTLYLPWFQSDGGPGYLMYSYFMAANVLGRFVGGAVQYKLKYPTARKFAIAFCVYAALSVVDGSILYLPVAVMTAASFFEGVLGVTSYNIRISTTQSYVPNDYRGRFNGVFQMVTFGGSIIGQLASGALAEALPARAVVSGFMVLNFIAVFAIMLPGRKYVKEIYNRDV
jgi:DHA3 family macrolide efflux protein-like MFS transporter